MMRGMFAADSFVFTGDLVSRLLNGTDGEKAQIAAYYPRMIFKEAKIEVGEETIFKILKAMMRYYRQGAYRLYDDVLPALKGLKERGLKLGLVTNASKDQIASVAGLGAYIDLIANAEEAGADKPKPPIFELALKKAGIAASESAHVGDQYELDVVGAEGVGIKPILIDRYDLYPETKFRPRILSLKELPKYL
jgi:HAD superfamily hydrolase (TIGR01549 family)